MHWAPQAADRRLTGGTPALPGGLPPLGGGIGGGQLRQAATVAVGLDEAAGLGEGGGVAEEAGAVQGDVGEEQGHHATDAKGNFVFDREVALDRSRPVLDMRRKR